MPQLVFPDMFLGFLDNQSYTPFESFSNNPNGNVDDSVGNPRQCQSVPKTTTYPYPNDVMFSVMFLFDETRMSYDKSNLVLYPPPIICNDSSGQTFSGADLLIKVETAFGVCEYCLSNVLVVIEKAYK